MNNIIIGNGIDIQFGGFDYTNKSIIERALSNLATENFSIEVWLYILYSTIPDFLKGDYDQFTALSYEKEELDNFKKNYPHWHSFPTSANFNVEHHRSNTITLLI
jgi:hypothetical protein